ncbi:MAG TPA: GNAT family N-acetyltransferase [Dongiaceae bacterium]|nr:GNAT family N-acetyltransferase [Dongiaceae bacterium]
MIERIDAAAFDTVAEGLCALLCECVHAGASVGFLAPLTPALARDYWKRVQADLKAGERLLLVWRDQHRILGSVQVNFATPLNQRHRVDIVKLLVLPEVRRQGIGSRLMTAAEEAVREAGRFLLVLDTREGDAANRLYERLSYLRAGAIPFYARSSQGSLDTTIIYYKRLDPAASASLKHKP